MTEPGRTLVIVPTYNEAENVGGTVARLRAAVPQADVLIADDNSPDGTGVIADSLSDRDSAIHVLRRPAKEGLGPAYLAGFAWGMERDYGLLVEMDADGSHQPEQLPTLLRAAVDADLVLGSRWVPGGSVRNWPKSRELISRAGNLWTRIALGLRLKDATGGYRVFRRATLEGIGLCNVASAGYCFQIDLAWRAVRRGFVVREVPITFVERKYGDSKMGRRIVAEALWRTAWWGMRRRWHQLHPVRQNQPGNPTAPTDAIHSQERTARA